VLAAAAGIDKSETRDPARHPFTAGTRPATTPAPVTMARDRSRRATE
jgi:hypothetical protein